MTKTIITSDNWIDSTFNTVYFHGGGWETESPFSNVRDEKTFKKAISTDATTASTQGEIFLGGDRDVRIVAIPDHNITTSGSVRFRGSSVGKWDGLELNASLAGGESSIEVLAENDVIITSGDLLGINGSNVVYTAGSSHSISNSGTATVSVSPTVSGSHAAGLEVFALEGLYERETFLTVVGSHATDATSIAVEADSNGASLDGGEYICFDSGDYAYKVETSLSLGAGASGALTLSSGLQESLAGGEEVTFTEYDSGMFDATPVVPWGSWPWGTPNLLTGTMTDEEREKRTLPTIKVFDNVITKYWKFEVDDTTNTDGYVTIPRIVVAPGIEFSINPEYGAQIGVETDTTATRSLGGSDFYQRRGNRKVMVLQFRNLELDELYNVGLDLILDRGIDKQVFVVFNPEDESNLWRNSMLATMKELSPLQFDYHQHGSKAFSLEQVL